MGSAGAMAVGSADRYYQKKYHENQKFNFLYLGRIIKDKGIKEYLKAIANIKIDFPNINFIFVGKINTNNKELTNLFNQFIKKNFIIFKSEINDVRDELYNCDCVVLPSYREGLSKTLLEASAIGRPMLVSDVPGCKDIVKDGFNGLLFKPKNYKSLQNTLLTNNILDLNKCNIYIVTVPTPVNSKNIPNLNPLKKACLDISKFLKLNDIVIFESTVFPGLTEDYCVNWLKKYNNLIYNKDFFCGYSPERINPGDKTKTLTNIIKITSGSNKSISNKIDKLYRSIITFL